LNANLPQFGPEATKWGQASGYVVTDNLPTEPLLSTCMVPRALTGRNMQRLWMATKRNFYS
jgi:hypothetical protein